MRLEQVTSDVPRIDRAVRRGQMTCSAQVDFLSFGGATKKSPISSRNHVHLSLLVESKSERERRMQKAIWSSLILMILFIFAERATVEAREGSKNAVARTAVATQRLNQSSWLESLRDFRRKIGSQTQASGDGTSFVVIIPYVTTESNSRTNLGLNNYSQISFVHGINPFASVFIYLFDQEGSLRRSGSVVVESNELVQINDIINQLPTIEDPVQGGNVGTGWLLIFSDEPLTAWASVISNSNDDPSIELAIADQISKPAAFVESTGTRLAIQSSAKTAKFQSSLVVVNVGPDDGNLYVDIYDQLGNLIDTKTALIKQNGMFVDNDIRSAVPDTFGQIVIEVTDPTPNDDKAPRLVANSIVKSTVNGTGAFFPAFALPQVDTKAIAGVWEGSLTGSLINAQVKMQLFQERDMIYGTLDILSGSFPTVARSFSISGEVSSNHYLLQVQDAFDSDSANTFFSYRLHIPPITGIRMEGDTLYFDEQNRKDIGSVSLSRTGSIYQ